MIYFVIGGAIIGFIFNGFTGAIVMALVGAAVRRWIFGIFWK